jgi:hypothetical protein
MSKNSVKTGERIATKASNVLRKSKNSIMKSLAGNSLSNARPDSKSKKK